MARVLVVDDSGIVRRNMRMMLKTAGHDVIAEADNGRNAYAEYKIKLPDLVTMDLIMPDMDGIEAMQKILCDFPDAKIVVVSGSSEKETIIKAIKCGACHFLIKPIKQEKLTAVVNMVLTKDGQNKRLELVEKLNAMNDREPAVKTPPYTIEDKEGKYVEVKINETIDDNDVDLLYKQIDELLYKFQLKFIFDFGNGLMPRGVLPKVNTIIIAVKQGDGMVRAVSSNADFVQQIKKDKGAIASGLADAIRFLPNA